MPYHCEIIISILLLKLQQLLCKITILLFTNRVSFSLFFNEAIKSKKHLAGEKPFNTPQKRAFVAWLLLFIHVFILYVKCA